MSNDSQNGPASELTWLARNVDEFPEGKELIGIDPDGEVRFCPGNGADYYPNPLPGLEYRQDAHGAHLTREQWAAERQRLGLEGATNKDSLLVGWNGEGLPPAGADVEIECSPGSGRWVSAKVTAHGVDHGHDAAIVQTENRIFILSEQHLRQLRPRRTPEEVEREELEDLIYRGVSSGWNAATVAKHLLAKGYRKQGARS